MNDGLDSLYAAPLAEFTKRRNELAKSLRADGDKEAADVVKGLKKPSTAAWVVNQLHFEQGALLQRLKRASEAIRDAHASPDGDLRGAIEERRSALDALIELAREILIRGGVRPTKEQVRRVTRTLEAVSTRLEGPGPGRLVQDLEPAGFGALSGFTVAPAPPPKGGSKMPPQDKSATQTSQASTQKGPARKPRKAPPTPDPAAAVARALEAARHLVEQEEARLGRAEREASRAETGALAAARRAEKLADRVRELEGRVEEARAALEEARTEATAKAEAHREADALVETARVRAREAREALDLARSAPD